MSTLLAKLLESSWTAGELSEPDDGPVMSARLTQQTRSISEAIAPELPHTVAARLVVAFTQLLGTVSMELGGQYVGSVDPTDDYFDYVIETFADFVGLPPDPD